MIWKKFLALGNSNTQYGFSREGCWLSELANMLQRKCDVINRGFSGYNTNHVLSILPTIMQEFSETDICGVTLMMGSNDSVSAENKIQHCSLDQYKANMRSMIDYLLCDFKLESSKLILITPPRIFDEKWHNSRSGATHFDHLVEKYARACRDIGREYNLSVVDLYQLMEDYGPNYEELLHDGLHLSAKGSELLFNSLSKIVNEKIEPRLKHQYPYWGDLKEGQTSITC